MLSQELFRSFLSENRLASRRLVKLGHFIVLLFLVKKSCLTRLAISVSDRIFYVLSTKTENTQARTK